MPFYKYICQPHTFMPAFPIVCTLNPVPPLVFRRLQFGIKSLSRFSILQATESWVGPGYEASNSRLQMQNTAVVSNLFKLFVGHLHTF